MNEVEVVGPTPLAAATANAKKWIESHPAGKPVKIPTTLTVRHRKHLVSVPVAQALAQQYERVGRVSNAALREMVIFGAMLDRIDKALSSSRYTRSDNGPGVSLRSWLAENCPGIEYATAMDYKRTTRNYMAYLKLKEDTPLLEMMQADPYDDEKKENLRRQILDTMAHLTKSQLRRLTDAGYLTPAQRDAVDPARVAALFAHPLGQRILHASTVHREVRFLLEYPAAQWDPAAGNGSESVVLQGVADCVLEYDDGLVLIDFKTDRASADVLRQRYAQQLALYARALTGCFGKPVREQVLYATHLNDVVPLGSAFAV